MTEKRRRDQTLSIRLTQAEKDMLLDRVHRAGMTLTEYIICAGLFVSINAPPDLSGVLIEMKRAGNNINQIAMKINTGVVRSANFDEVVNLYREILAELRRIGRSE